MIKFLFQNREEAFVYCKYIIQFWKLLHSKKCQPQIIELEPRPPIKKIWSFWSKSHKIMILYDIGLSLAEFFKMMSDFLLVHQTLIKNSH